MCKMYMHMCVHVHAHAHAHVHTYNIILYYMYMRLGGVLTCKALSTPFILRFGSRTRAWTKAPLPRTASPAGRSEVERRMAGTTPDLGEGGRGTGERERERERDRGGREREKKMRGMNEIHLGLVEHKSTCTQNTCRFYSE